MRGLSAETIARFYQLQFSQTSVANGRLDIHIILRFGPLCYFIRSVVAMSMLCHSRAEYAFFANDGT